MDFGAVLQTNPPASRTIHLAKLAEQHGFSHVWTFDSHLLWQEPYVIYSQILAETRRVKVGPFVTNPATRDWTVTASVFATLNEMYGNRTVVGIGRGDSAVRVTNGKPTTLAELRESIHVIRELGNSRAVEYNGADAAVPVEPVGSELEVWVAAYGPLALKLTGEVGDGFILQLADVDIAKWMIKTVRDAAENVGPRPRLDHVLRRRADVHRRRLGAHARPVPLVRRHGRQPRRRHRREVRHRRLGARRRSPTTSRAARATTTTRTARPATTTSTSCPTRSSTGSACSAPPTQHIEKLEELKSIGVDQFAGYLQHDNKEETLRVYGETVIPALSRPPDGQGMTADATGRLADPAHGAHPRRWGASSACSRSRVIWELYKFLGPAEGVVVGAIDGRDRLGLPAAAAHERPRDAAHLGDVRPAVRGHQRRQHAAAVRHGRRRRRCSPSASRRSAGSSAWSVGMLLGLVMQRWRLAEWGLLPWIVVSQTVPLIAFAPVVNAIGTPDLARRTAVAAVAVGRDHRLVPGVLPGRGRRAARARRARPHPPRPDAHLRRRLLADPAAPAAARRRARTCCPPCASPRPTPSSAPSSPRCRSACAAASGACSSSSPARGRATRPHRGARRSARSRWAWSPPGRSPSSGLVLANYRRGEATA